MTSTCDVAVWWFAEGTTHARPRQPGYDFKKFILYRETATSAIDQKWDGDDPPFVFFRFLVCVGCGCDGQKYRTYGSKGHNMLHDVRAHFVSKFKNA